MKNMKEKSSFGIKTHVNKRIFIQTTVNIFFQNFVQFRSFSFDHMKTFFQINSLN